MSAPARPVGVNTSCACGAEAVLVVVVHLKAGSQAFGFCAVHARTLGERPDIVDRLTGRATIVTTFTARRLRQVIDRPP